MDSRSDIDLGKSSHTVIYRGAVPANIGVEEHLDELT